MGFASSPVHLQSSDLLGVFFLLFNPSVLLVFPTCGWCTLVSSWNHTLVNEPNPRIFLRLPYRRLHLAHPAKASYFLCPPQLYTLLRPLIPRSTPVDFPHSTTPRVLPALPSLSSSSPRNPSPKMAQQQHPRILVVCRVIDEDPWSCASGSSH
ncbi:hypothetical protein LINGRAHAP2_LOCUS32935 [Linum grandiflorum]